ncbi:MAG: glycoside hydrolase family 28 protein [Pirellulales bacterium]|nr:glycoside hydrolase family 28 protein [Pirellulales bacterium]
MRTTRLLTLILGLVVVLHAAIVVARESGRVDEVATATGWDHVPAILQRIKPPGFPDRDFVVVDFGAVGDGATDCKPAFDRAIAACLEQGGGRVVAPKGKWVVNGPIHLKSRVNLYLERGATIRFSSDPKHYLPAVFTRFEGTELMNYSPLVYAIDQENIAITGEGTLDGQAGPKAWWPWKGPWGGDVDHGWREGDPNQLADVQRLGELSDAAVPPTERVFGDKGLLRPSFVQFYRCKNVLIEGVTVTNAPMWLLHPVLCENLTIRGVTVRSHGPNNDGCNPESCRDVLIENCTFDTGDDCIAIKSGRNADGRRLARPSENIVIRGCTMKDGHGGVTLGSEMSGGIRNVFVEDCSMSSPRLDRAIRLKSNSLRGGFLENLFVRNIRVGEVSDAVIHIDLRYNDETGEHNPVVRNLFIDGVKSQKSGRPLFLLGIEGQPIQNVVVSNSRFENAAKPSVIEYVDELALRNVMQPE